MRAKLSVLFFSLVLIALSLQNSGRFFLPITAKPIPAQIEKFHFGYRHVISDLIWLNLIQVIDEPEHSNLKPQAHRSYVYSQVLNIFKLSPLFRIPAAVGPLTLSVLLNDSAGASQLYDLAVQNFPQDWPILYRAAHHALSEEHNKAKAAQLLQRAGQFGAPAWVYSLATRLYSESGQLEMAQRLLDQIQELGVSPEILARVKARIQSAPR